jgi:hypothetical protein
MRRLAAQRNRMINADRTLLTAGLGLRREKNRKKASCPHLFRSSGKNAGHQATILTFRKEIPLENHPTGSFIC